MIDLSKKVRGFQKILNLLYTLWLVTPYRGVAECLYRYILRHFLGWSLHITTNNFIKKPIENEAKNDQ